MIWRLLCFVLVFKAAESSPIRKTGSAASQEEVNVLMFGVIQFSESLNYAHEATAAKIAKIIQALKIREATLQQLGAQTEKAAEVERQTKDVITLLQEQMAKQEAQTRMTRDWLARIEQEEEQLRSKVKRMDSYLNTSIDTSIKELQERAKEHSSMLQGIQLFTQFQRESIESQNQHLQRLQKQLPQSRNKHHTDSTSPAHCTPLGPCYLQME